MYTECCNEIAQGNNRVIENNCSLEFYLGPSVKSVNFVNILNHSQGISYIATVNIRCCLLNIFHLYLFQFAAHLKWLVLVIIFKSTIFYAYKRQKSELGICDGWFTASFISDSIGWGMSSSAILVLSISAHAWNAVSAFRFCLSLPIGACTTIKYQSWYLDATYWYKVTCKRVNFTK